MNIVLIGMRGSGKTTVGRILARKLGRELVETDELITHKAGGKAGLSIAEIVQKYGWEKFRDIEEEVTSEVAGRDNIVNAAGGGVVTREKNTARLKKNGILVWLTAGLDTLLERIGEDSQRPLLAGKTRREDMEITLKEREPLYGKAADLVVDSESKTAEEAAEAIVKSLKKICCLIGDPVEHSLSPLIHNAGYKALGIDYVYLPFQVKDFKRAIEGIRGLGIRGASITMPYKARAMEYVDGMDRVAVETGAVNTIVNNDGVLTGYNTDYHGALKALEEAAPLEGKRAVLVGGGGAATAIALGLKRGGAKLVILNRTKDKAKKLGEMLDAEVSGGMDKLKEIASADILINATSVGMMPKTDQSIIPKKFLHEGLTVFDIVYNPRETRLLAEAREKGCAVIYGYKMLLYQAAMQFELFTGQQPPLSIMESALTEALEGGENATHSDRG
jgi:shikimate dehydrogenase